MHLLAVVVEKKIDLTTKPESDDPNKYCKSCRRTYRNKYIYRRHLHKYHGFASERHGKHNIQPDLNYLNNHCKSCEHTYSTKDSYRLHLHPVHKIEGLLFKRNNQKPFVSSSAECRSCNKFPFYSPKFINR
jgi:hypothetical protein